MANNFSVRVDNSFNLNSLVQFVAEKYRSKGYSADIQNNGNEKSIKISKNTDIGYTLIGMVESVVVKLKVENGTLFVSFTETEYTSKIIAAILAFFCAGALWITMIIGLVNQSDLNSGISKDIKAYLSGNAVKKTSEIPVQNAFVQETPVQHTDVQEETTNTSEAQVVSDSEDIFAHDDTELDKTMGIF